MVCSGARQAPGDAFLPASADQRPRGDRKFGPQILALPAQVVDQCGALPNEAFAVIDEQPNVELGAGELRNGQRIESFADCCPRDLDGIDQIRLAALTG